MTALEEAGFVVEQDDANNVYYIKHTEPEKQYIILSDLTGKDIPYSLDNEPVLVGIFTVEGEYDDCVGFTVYPSVNEFLKDAGYTNGN